MSFDPPEPKPLAIRFVGDMQRLELRPGDVYVVTIEAMISPEARDFIRRDLQRQLGADAKIVICAGGMKLGVISNQDPAI